MSKARSHLDRWLDAFNAQDLEALCAIADPEIEIVPIEAAATAPPGAIYRGHTGLRSLFGRSFGHFSDIRLDYSDVQELGRMLLVALRIALTVDGGPPSVVHTHVLYEFAGERLTRIESFASAAGARAAAMGRAAQLSPRELEVVELLANGRTAAEAARDLVLSPHTVRTHIRNAKDKLGAHTTAELVAKAVRTRAIRS